MTYSVKTTLLFFLLPFLLYGDGMNLLRAE